MKLNVEVKAVGVLGLVWGILLLPYTSPALFTADVKGQIVSFMLARSVDPNTVELIYGLFMAFLIGLGVVVCGFVGVILGAVFGWAYEKIPGKTWLRKGIIFGGFFWIILILGGLGTAIQPNLTPLEILRDGRIALAYSLAFGVLLAIFYNKYKVRGEPFE